MSKAEPNASENTNELQGDLGNFNSIEYL